MSPWLAEPMQLAQPDIVHRADTGSPADAWACNPDAWQLLGLEYDASPQVTHCLAMGSCCNRSKQCHKTGAGYSQAS